MSNPNEINDQPSEGPLVTLINPEAPLPLPALVIGGGVLSNQYNTDDHLESLIPQRIVQLAFRYGIRAIDTSIYYGPSELVLGKALQAIKDEFPRSSYTLLTKCGRFGATTFDYSPDAIRDSVKRSLQRLQTDYLDVVYLHDTEFVCTSVMPVQSGNHLAALSDKRAEYGLAEGQEGIIRGEGDQKILDAFNVLREFQEQGIIKRIGITGYPQPVLLRLALLILHNPPYKPVDIIMSYSHLTLQNESFLQFASELRARAKVQQLVTASPFSMGLLTPNVPAWHPAPEELKTVSKTAGAETGTPLTDVALGYAIRKATENAFPLVAGFSNPQEVHECVRVWREVTAATGKSADREEKEAIVRKMYQDTGYADWSWASP
ncbi:Aldo/keto reductase [Cylindrobasidium torrendii FP15055 ss-10]|uniref:Aldo/keto reductase n=1 Tax=Cylindrobasidium torrendii FP15055 ss-10 TaxID=1314674 RepID=A0A0D7BNQ8_9AGAR|nr:Aldo/keto reductase [Cylindrobasidium torrendii FP15055 ss-10]